MATTTVVVGGGAIKVGEGVEVGTTLVIVVEVGSAGGINEGVEVTTTGSAEDVSAGGVEVELTGDVEVAAEEDAWSLAVPALAVLLAVVLLIVVSGAVGTPAAGVEDEGAARGALRRVKVSAS